MSQSTNAALHDAYAADYDKQVHAYSCNIGEVLFGLCYEFTQPEKSLLDVGIGSGLSAQLFAKAGVEIHGMDFSPAMLEICQEKGFTKELKEHDILHAPWPYPPQGFDYLVCCGVMHFIPDLEVVFHQAERVLVKGGVFAFTTKASPQLDAPGQKYEQQESGDFQIFSHATDYIESQLKKHGFARLKGQKCFVGEDVFTVWIVKKEGVGNSA